jgi:cell wall-associated NlpC family hydrolase
MKRQKYLIVQSFVLVYFAQAGVQIPRMSVDQYVWGIPIKKGI